MEYTESEMFAKDFDPATLKAGDTFMYNDQRYTIERVYTGGPFMVYTTDPTVIHVVSYEDDGVGYFKVATWDGDWQGCHPAALSVEEALFAEIARGCEIINYEFA